MDVARGLHFLHSNKVAHRQAHQGLLKSKEWNPQVPDLIWMQNCFVKDSQAALGKTCRYYAEMANNVVTAKSGCTKRLKELLEEYFRVGQLME